MARVEESIDIAALALTLVGEFAIVQESVDGLVDLYVNKRAPGLKRFLADQGVINRLPDKQRPRLVLDIAKDLEAPSDLSRFTDVFHRVKKTRDGIAHSVRVERIDADTLRLVQTRWASVDGSTVEPVVITRQELATRLNDARWLDQHVRFLLRAGGGLVIDTYLGDRRIEVSEPSADPQDWEERMFVFVDVDEVETGDAEGG